MAKRKEKPPTFSCKTWGGSKCSVIPTLPTSSMNESFSAYPRDMVTDPKLYCFLHHLLSSPSTKLIKIKVGERGLLFSSLSCSRRASKFLFFFIFLASFKKTPTAKTCTGLPCISGKNFIHSPLQDYQSAHDFPYYLIWVFPFSKKILYSLIIINCIIIWINSSQFLSQSESILAN